MFRSHQLKGQSLIEIVFILGVTILLLSGVVVSAIFSLKMAHYSKQKAIATRLARQLIEEKRSAKQEADFWEQLAANPPAGTCWEEETCSDTQGPQQDVFYYKTCYCGFTSSNGRNRVNFKSVVWWSSLVEPTTKNKIEIETLLSNWEQ